MFDVEAYRRQQTGSNPDKGLLATFRYEYDEKTKEQVPYINIWLGKNDQVDRKATKEDMERFADRWAAFEKGEDRPPDGLPINQVPFATPAAISSCKSEKIYTVEQLVETPDVRLQRAGLLNFKSQCADMLKQLKDSQHIIEMRAEMEDLKRKVETLEEDKANLKAQLEEQDTPKRGRKSSGNASSDSKQNTA